MAQQDIETLRKARESFVRKRRLMAEQMVPDGAAAQHFAPAFADIQAAVEAIDRAIQDVENLPEGYAESRLPPPTEPDPADSTASSAADSVVVAVDFDPA
jgi:hypothetical protein